MIITASFISSVLLPNETRDYYPFPFFPNPHQRITGDPCSHPRLGYIMLKSPERMTTAVPASLTCPLHQQKIAPGSCYLRLSLPTHYDGTTPTPV